MSHSAHAPELPYCRNCHFTLGTPRPVYCGHCGQETDLHPPSVREMVTEYLGHYVAFDGPLWRTLWALICLPGHLTNAYFRGQRRRYVLPLRVYLSASFVFFVGSALLPAAPDEVSPEDAKVAAAEQRGEAAEQRAKAAKTVRVRPDETPASAAERAASEAGLRQVRISSQWGNCENKPVAECSFLERALTRLTEKAQARTSDQWSAKLRAMAPYGMLAVQPLFAALLLMMFAGSGRRYAEHFVFSLHSHSLWFLALLLANAVGLEALLIFGVFAHGLTALRRVYGLGWAGAFWRGLLLSAGYFVLLMLVAAAFGVVVVALA